MATYTNISSYLFAPLSDLKSLREQLKQRCKELNLKGTILLSPEGINLFIAGFPEDVELLVQDIRQVPGLENLAPKHSPSDEQPFRRMLVRLKKEIIAFGVEGINPGLRTSPKLKAAELKQWLDEGRPVTLLDTRNDYEVKLGTFKNAQILDLQTFRRFPDAVRDQVDPALKKQPVVMFCTGGIRCEKAGPFMEQEGFEQIYQLDGGILKYFEEVGSDHYEGSCFVFDQRVGVDPALQETEEELCFNCQTPLTEDEAQDSRYVRNVSCPYCFKTTEEQAAEKLAESQARLNAVCTPLPGSAPYHNLRPLNVPAEYDGKTLLDALCGIFPHIGREEWLKICEQGSFVTDDGQAVPANQPVRGGERYCRLQLANVEPEVNANIQLVFEDEALIVLEKPAPLPMHAGGRFNRNSLQYLLNQAFDPILPRPMHRLDANTTGLVLYTKTRHFAKLLQPQFTRGQVSKTYLAKVQGHPEQDLFECRLPIPDEAGPMGTRRVDEENGQEAHTKFEVIQRNEDGTALLLATPVTGRTNQIRVHLWQLGFPIVGDQAYLPNGKLGDTQTLPIHAPALCLHAWKLGFKHPLTQSTLSFETERPAWA